MAVVGPWPCGAGEHEWPPGNAPPPRGECPRGALTSASVLLGEIHAMRGIITGRDVLQNVGIIYREFGARCLVRCLWVLAIRKRTTFLDVISQH